MSNVMSKNFLQKVDVQGFQLSHDNRMRLDRVLWTIRKLVPISELKITLLKTGRVYEAFFSGKIESIPIGFYQRGPSFPILLENLFKRGKKECLRLWRRGRCKNRDGVRPTNRPKEMELELAS